MIATPMGNNGTLPKIHSPTAHVCRTVAVVNSSRVRCAVRDVSTAREIAPCPTDACAEFDAERDVDDSSDDYFNERGNMDYYPFNRIAHEYTDGDGHHIIYANGKHYVHFNADTSNFRISNSHSDNSSGTQSTDAAAITEHRRERGGHCENDQNT